MLGDGFLFVVLVHLVVLISHLKICQTPQPRVSTKSWPATTLHWIRRVLCDVQICDNHPVLCSHHEQEVMSPCADRFRWRSWRLPWTNAVLPPSANWPLWTRTVTSSWPPSASLALRGRAPRWVRILAKKTKKKKKESLFLKIVIF